MNPNKNELINEMKFSIMDRNIKEETPTIEFIKKTRNEGNKIES